MCRGVGRCEAAHHKQKVNDGARVRSRVNVIDMMHQFTLNTPW
eukprot:gene26074-60923_t